MFDNYDVIIIISIFAGIGIIYKFLQWAAKSPNKPDPWESDENYKGTELEKDGEGTPLCTNCLSPIKNSSQDYCPECGNVTGKFTRYVPFINIPFNYSIIKTLWETLTKADKPFIKRVIAFFVCLILAPLTLVIGIPVFIISLFVKKKQSLPLHEEGKY